MRLFGTDRSLRRPCQITALTRVSNSHLVVAHYGPDADDIGGIESLLRTYRNLDSSTLSMAIHATTSASATWSDKARKLFQAVASVRHLSSCHVHRRHVVHVHLSQGGSAARKALIVFVASARGLPVYTTVHGSRFSAFVRSSSIGRILVSHILHKSNGVIVLNNATRDVVRSLAPETRVKIVNNPSPAAFTSYDAAEASFPRSREVVFAGSVGVRKGVPTLLDAWDVVRRRAPEARLVIFGPVEHGFDDPRLADYHAGAVPAEEVVARLARARVATLPSTAEAMPIFAIEALGAACPLVVSDVGALPELARNCGTVVPVGESDALATALLHYISDDAAASIAGLEGFKKHDSAYSIHAHLEALAELYRDSVDA